MHRVLLAVGAFLHFCFFASAAPFNPWKEQLDAAPGFSWDSGFETNGIRGLFFDGVPWHGKPTRVFAWFGMPRGPVHGKVPAMVLVHGGGGTAFADWVRLWNERGYAAIAMDTCGSVPRGTYGKWERHAEGGPPGWGGFDKVDEPLADQWTFHAVSAVIRAHSLIRGFSDIDKRRIGITGISWGGYLTCISASVDPRYQFAAPVYGCGFLGEDSAWLDVFKGMGPEKSAKWLSHWDPSVFLPGARMPFLWVTGTTDFAYPMDSLQKSYRLPKTRRHLAIRVNMPHAHGGPGEKPPEILSFADYLFRKGEPLPVFVKQSRPSQTAWAAFRSAVPILRAELNFTRDNGPWSKRKWETVPARLEKDRVEAELPHGARVYYFNIVYGGDRVASSEHVEIP